jgi:steroid 5-alpha reductase family enzyme
MLEALTVNAAILIATVLALWLISVRINDVSFIDAFWGSGMGLMALVSWWQVRPAPGPLASLIMADDRRLGVPARHLPAAALAARG